jgi:hypothetical protein
MTNADLALTQKLVLFLGAGQMDMKRIKELERKIAELKKNLPAHSVKAEMLIELEELEEKLEEAKGKYDG